MKRQVTIWVIALLTSVVAVAQPPKRKSPEEFKKEYQAFITRQAQLTEEEAAAFFPIYDECQEKKRDLNDRIWKLRKDTRDKELSETEYRNILEKTAQLRIQIDELEKSYLPLFHKVLSYKKIFEVQGAESRFHRELLKGMHHHRKEEKRENK